VLVRKNGHAVFERATIKSALENQDRHAYEFPLASCTKQFTAMAIMLLVHDGKLRYDETLAESFPDFPCMENPSPFEISSTTLPDCRTTKIGWSQRKKQKEQFGRRKNKFKTPEF